MRANVFVIKIFDAGGLIFERNLRDKLLNAFEMPAAWARQAQS